MGKIRILEADVYNKIAAGEVIERPLSVVKELVENALDAGADEISIHLVEGGKTAISVEDNGEGFLPEDIATAFRRHSTSKLSRLDDLDRISTLGFRGEALPSILEVSRVKLKSANHPDGAGIFAVFENREMVRQESVACRRGTRIEVEDLFYNFPVRKKFLKTARSELNGVVSFVEPYALVNFAVSFSLFHDSRTIFLYKKTASLRERIYQVFGKDFLDSVQEIHFSEPPYVLNGFVSRWNTGVGHKKHQFFFVNSRPVREKTIFSALNQTFQKYLEKSRSPAAILLLDVPSRDIDVNIHPMKLEIKFRDSGLVFQFLKRAIDRALTGRESPARENGLDRGLSGLSPEEIARTFFADQRIPRPAGDDRQKTAGLFPGLNVPDGDFSLIGQYQNSFIVVEKSGELLIIDQHNAHERIQFERLKKEYAEERVVAISPLFPVVLELTASEKIGLDASKMDLLERMGFELRALSGHSYDVKKFPRILEERNVREVILTIIHLKEEEPLQLEDRVLCEIACKSSIKVNHRLYPEEMKQIVRDLFQTANPGFCPHQRPVFVKITREEIEKKLKRK